MSEKIPPFENREYEARQPALLDLIKIDGRWCQVCSLPTASWKTTLLRFLEDNTSTYIDLAEYESRELPHISAGSALANKDLSDEEFKNIRWDGDNIGTELATHVHVFGEFIKKEQHL